MARDGTSGKLLAVVNIVSDTAMGISEADNCSTGNIVLAH